jgi:F1F0 ATPase subunit 2
MIGTDLTGLVIAFAAGAAMGAGYFAGLWLTLCRMAKASSPYRLYGVSLLLRLTLLLGGFYLLAIRGYGGLLAAAVGFMVSRQLWLISKRSRGGQPAPVNHKDP